MPDKSAVQDATYTTTLCLTGVITLSVVGSFYGLTIAQISVITTTAATIT